MNPAGRQGSSRRSREQALKVLFEADVRGTDALAVMQQDPAAMSVLADDDEAGSSVSTDIGDFARHLVEGVVGQRGSIDQTITRHARGWQLHRMPAVDRTILRIATFELFDRQATPATIINEAIELAKAYSTADSGRYVNGVLEAIRKASAAAPDTETHQVADSGPAGAHQVDEAADAGEHDVGGPAATA